MNDLGKIRITLGFLTAVAVAIAAMIILQGMDVNVMTAELAVLSWVSFALLGIVLLVLTKRAKVRRELKILLLIAGWSPVAFTAGVFLHNMFYALGTVTEHLAVIHLIADVLGGLFFFVSVLLAPIAFLVGLIGSIVLLFRKGKSTEK